MKFLCLLAGVAFFQGVTAADPESSTKDVKVSYTGSSGGFRMSLVNDDKTFIKISQSKVEECDDTGKAVTPGWQFTPTNGAWTTEEDAENGVTTTTYTKTQGDMTFQMVTMLSEDTTQVFDRTVNETVTVPANKLKFSIAASGFEFKDAKNSLCYSIDVATKAGDKTKSEKKGNTFSQGGATIETDTKCTVDGESKDVDVTESQTGQKSSIDFRFPSFTSSLAYDPSVGLTGAAWTSAPSMLLVTALSVLAYLQQ